MAKQKKLDWLTLVMGIIFLSAAIFRIFNYTLAKEELINLNLPLEILPVIILLEIMIGTLFIINKKIRFATITTIIFLSLAIVSVFILNFNKIINSIPQLMIFRADATDVFLHVVYVFLLIIILKKYSWDKIIPTSSKNL